VLIGRLRGLYASWVEFQPAYQPGWDSIPTVGV